jgi:hypothetical protein
MAQLGDIGERVDLLIRQGCTFGPHEVRLTNPDDTPVNLTGATVRGTIRKDYESPNISASLVVEWVDQAEGVFKFSLADTVTAELAAGKTVQLPHSLYVWDFEIEYLDGAIRPLFWGEVRVHPEVTR